MITIKIPLKRLFALRFAAGASTFLVATRKVPDAREFSFVGITRCYSISPFRFSLSARKVLFLAWPRKSTQKEGHPSLALRVPSPLALWRANKNSLRSNIVR